MQDNLHSTILPILTSFPVQELERQIILEYDSSATDYTKDKALLQLRKTLLNRELLQHQELLLPHIEAFNDALIEALRTTYNETHRMYALLTANGYCSESIEVKGCCYLNSTYSVDHLLQDAGRQNLWEALLDDGWNPLYRNGVSHPLIISYSNNESFNDYIGMTSPHPNWNEGLDQAITQGMHICSAFHNLFDHTCFALTDFIFCRHFNPTVEVKIAFNN